MHDWLIFMWRNSDPIAPAVGDDTDINHADDNVPPPPPHVPLPQPPLDIDAFKMSPWLHHLQLCQPT